MDQQWCLTAPPWVRVRVARIQGETREFHGECTAVYKMRGGWWGREGFLEVVGQGGIMGWPLSQGRVSSRAVACRC